jgi:lysophospholipase L1-like esterase
MNMKTSTKTAIEMSTRMPLGGAVLAFALVGFSSAAAVAQPRMPTHVACVGDSITAGVGSTSGTRTYPADLQAMFGSSVQVGNFGHSGATMLTVGDLPYRNQSEFTAATTFVSNAGSNAVVDVIIMLGTNDSKPYNWNGSGGGTRAQQFMTDCAALADHFANLATRPVVYLALPLAAFANTFSISGAVINDGINPVIRQVAMQKGLPIIDLYAPTSAHGEYFTDGVHPNDNGYCYACPQWRSPPRRRALRSAVRSSTSPPTPREGRSPSRRSSSCEERRRSAPPCNPPSRRCGPTPRPVRTRSPPKPQTGRAPPPLPRPLPSPSWEEVVVVVAVRAADGAAGVDAVARAAAVVVARAARARVAAGRAARTETVVRSGLAARGPAARSGAVARVRAAPGPAARWEQAAR